MTRSTPTEVPLFLRFGAPVLTFIIVLLVYIVFIPQMSQLNAFQENTCTYKDHDVVPEAAANKCLAYSIFVTYEHAHDTLHQNAKNAGDQLPTTQKHTHSGVINAVNCEIKSKPELDQWIIKKYAKKPFTCFVNEIDPEHQVFTEKPSGSNMMYTIFLLFGLGGGAIFLLKSYVDWTAKQKRAGSSGKNNNTRAASDIKSAVVEKKRKSKKIE